MRQFVKECLACLFLVEETIVSSNFQRVEQFGEMKRDITTPCNFILVFINDTNI